MSCTGGPEFTICRQRTHGWAYLFLLLWLHYVPIASNMSGFDWSTAELEGFKRHRADVTRHTELLANSPSSTHPSLKRQIRQQKLLLDHIQNSLGPDPFLERFTRLEDPPGNMKHLRLEKSELLAASHPVPITSVFYRGSKTISACTTSNPSQPLANYPGAILTLTEFKALPFECYTAVDIGHLEVQTPTKTTMGRHPVTEEFYVVMGMPLSIGANVNCIRNTAAHENCRLSFSERFVMPVAATTSGRDVQVKGWLGDSSVCIRSHNRTIRRDQELVMQYGKSFWGELDISCHICCMFHSDDSNDIILCDRCDRGIHMKCLDPPMAVLPLPSTSWYCPTCSITRDGPNSSPATLLARTKSLQLKAK